MKYLFSLLLLINICYANYIRDDVKEVVFDTYTNLLWQDNSDANSSTMFWIDAIDYCESLSLAGYNNWRVPNFYELLTLVDRDVYNPAINSIFQYVASLHYWSSTADARHYLTYVSIIDFNEGGNSALHKSYNTLNIRCVHSIE